MRIRIPGHLTEKVAALALKGWVKKKDFPRDVYFRTVDDGLAILSRRDDPDDPPPLEGVVAMLAYMLDREGELNEYVVAEGTHSIGDAKNWEDICSAAGWVIVQAHALAVSKGEWP